MHRLAVFLATGIITLQAATPLVHHTFDNNDEGWTPFGKGGEIRITRDAADVKTGKGALAFDYDVSNGPALLALPINEPLTGMQSLRFWLKTDSATPIAVLLNEQTGGGHYVRVVWSPANKWQQIELQPSDFALSEGPNDPKDPDNKLDVGEIQSVALLDLSQMFNGMAKNSTVPIVIDTRTGKHTLFIDDFEISDGALVLPKAASEGVVIDSFSREALQWMTLGGVNLSMENQGMRARYQQEEDKYAILIRMLEPLDLRGWNRLAFDVASDKAAQLVISIEEHNPGKGQGPRYSTTVDVLGGGKVEHRAVTFESFAIDENGPADPNGKLDLNQIKTISILDITAATTHESATNSLWIGNLRTAEKADSLPAKSR